MKAKKKQIFTISQEINLDLKRLPKAVKKVILKQTRDNLGKIHRAAFFVLSLAFFGIGAEKGDITITTAKQAETTIIKRCLLDGNKVDDCKKLGKIAPRHGYLTARLYRNTDETPKERVHIYGKQGLKQTCGGWKRHKIDELRTIYFIFCDLEFDAESAMIEL